MKLAFNPSTVAALIAPPNNKDITFDLRGRNIFARGVKFCGTDTNTWRDIKINNVSIGSNILDLRNGSNITLTNTNGVVTINSTWRPVVDNLTSDSTTSSLSAKQGKVLKSLIDGKSNSGHTHDDRYLKLTGGTMASNALITFADSGSWGTDKGPQGARGGLYWTGQSDYAKLYAEETAKDNLDLVIQFGDDNSNGLSIRNKANTQTSYISAGGVITTGTFKGNLDWSYITNKPSSYTPSAHTHAWNSLTHSSTTENQAILTNGKANGWKLYTLNISRWDNAANNAHSHANKSVLDGITSGLVNNWNTAYTFVNTITGTDTDKVINKWDEIVNFLAGITEDNKLNTLLNSKLSIQQLSAKDILTTKTNNALFWVDTKGNASTITTGPFTDHPYALLSVTNYNQNAENYKFFYRSRLAFSSAGDIKVASCHHENEYKQDETWYNVLTSKNSGISGSTIKLNGTSITVYSSSTADGRYVKKSGDTMSGVLTIDTTNFGALTIKRNDDANGASIQFRGKSSVYGYIGLNNSTKDKQFLRWNSDTSKTYTILDTSSTYTSNGKGVINGTTITQVDNATNSTNSTNARKLVNWYSARPTSLNTQFGDGSLRIFYATSSTTEGKPAEDSHILHLAWDNNGGYDAQLAVHIRSGKVSTRAQNSGTWQPWKTLAFTTDIPTSLKNPHALTISLNGTSQGPYDGSAAKNVNITPSSIGAAPSSHTHAYLPLAGGTMTGNITYNRKGTSYIGNGENNAANGVGGALNNLVISSWYGVSFTTSCSDQTYTNKNAVSINCRNGYVYANTFVGTFSGNASTATKLTSSAGNAALPIYFSDGKPVACTASQIFSNLSNSGNNLSITVAGQNRTLTVAYANNTAIATRLKIYKEVSNNTNVYRVIGQQTLNGGWVNKGLVLAVASRHSGVGIYTIHYGAEISNGYYADRNLSGTDTYYTFSNVYCKIRYFGDTHDTKSSKIICHVKPATGNNPKSAVFTFFLHSNGGSSPRISILQDWGSPFELIENGATMSTIDTSIYGELKENTVMNESNSCTGNSATSTKLQTPRTLWGQSFDGTRDVSGSLSGVGHIQFSADNTYNIGSNSAASKYIYTYWLGAKSGQKLELGANNSGYGQGLCINTNLNVGIGTNAPAYKLHVAGDIYTTTGFKKNGSSDSYVLLGGGGHKAVSDFATASSLNNYVTTNTAQTISGVKTFSTQQKFTAGNGIAPFTVSSNTLVTNLNADLLDGYHASYSSSTPWGTIPVITTTGWMGIGKHLEFHHDNSTGSDYSTLLTCTGNYSNIVNLPSESGTLALTKDVLTFTIDTADYLSASFNNPDFSKKAASKYIKCWDGSGGWWNWMAGKFIKAGSSDSYVLLGGGGHKPLSEFQLGSGSYLPYNGWWARGSGQDVNDANGMIFAYDNHKNSPFSSSWGIITTFDYTYNSDYKFQLAANGYSNAMYYRSRSSDRGGWTSWAQVIDTGNIGSQTVDKSYHLRVNHSVSTNSTWSTWYWQGQSGQPTWLWGTNDGTNCYVWNPSNFRVAYASSAGNADTVDGTHLNGIFTAFGNNGHNITATIGGVTKSFLVDWAADSDKLDGYHADKYLMVPTIIDATSLNSDTYYPVTIWLPCKNTRIEVEVSLDSGTKPSWSTHPNGFTSRKVWESNGSGWGTTSVERNIFVSTYSFASEDPIRGIGQLTNSSIEFVYVRGGGKYYFGVSVGGGTPTLRKENYTINSQSIAPTKTAPDLIVPCINTPHRRVTLWGQSFNGTNSVSGSLSNTGTITASAAATYDIGSNTLDYRYGYFQQIRAKSNTNLRLAANNSDNQIVLHTNGNVGIGTASPTYKLHVIGDIYTTTGFKKNGSSNSYVLLGGGGHQTISSLSVNYANSAGNADYIRSNALPTPANNTVKAYKDSLVEFFKKYPNGIGANVGISASIISNWSNDAATYFDSSSYSVIKISGSYDGVTYGQFLLSSYELAKVGIVGRNLSQWSKIKWLAYEDQIPTDNNQLANGAGYITSSGSCAYATSAGNAETVDGYHATMGNNKPWGTIPVINLQGYMDIGKHLEFHYDNTTGSDYSTILRCTGNYANTVNLPSESGTLALTTDIPSSLKNPYALTLKANGTTLAIYDGSSVKEANFTYANVGAAPASHTHTAIVAEDLRSKYPGQILDPRRMKLSFLSASTLGIKDDGTYYDVITVRSYGDPSGGSDNALLFSKNTNSLYHTGFEFGSTSSWGSPLLIIDSGNIGSQSVAYASKAGSVAWSNVTGKPSSLKNPYSLNVFGVAYDGSATKTVTTSTFVSQLSEATSTITDGTMLITSYASNSGFADTNAVNVPYKRKAYYLWDYIKAKTDTLYSSKSHTHSYLPLAGGTMNASARISHGDGNLYIGRADNNGWILTQNIASQSGTDKWAIRTSGAAHFGALYIASKTDNSFNSNVIECNSTINLNYFSSQNVSLCNGGGTVQIGPYTTGDIGNNKLFVNGSEFIYGASNVRDHVFANGFRHRSHNSDDSVLLAGGGYSQGVPVRYWAIYYMRIGSGPDDISYIKRSGNHNFITSYNWQSEGLATLKINFPSGYSKNNTLIFGNGDHQISHNFATPVYVTIITNTDFGSASEIRVLLSNDSSLDTGYANIYFMCMG